MKEYWKEVLIATAIGSVVGVVRLWQETYQPQLQLTQQPTLANTQIQPSSVPITNTLPQQTATKSSDTSVELEYWKSAEKCGTEKCLQSYLTNYPHGMFAPVASAHIESLIATIQEDKSKIIESSSFLNIKWIMYWVAYWIVWFFIWITIGKKLSEFVFFGGIFFALGSLVGFGWVGAVLGVFIGFSTTKKPIEPQKEKTE